MPNSLFSTADTQYIKNVLLSRRTGISSFAPSLTFVVTEDQLLSVKFGLPKEDFRNPSHILLDIEEIPEDFKKGKIVIHQGKITLDGIVTLEGFDNQIRTALDMMKKILDVTNRGETTWLVQPEIPVRTK